MADTTDQTIENPESTEIATEQEAVAVEEIEATVEADATPEEVTEVEEEVGLVEETEATHNGVVIPDFRAGDTLRLGVRITEGDKTRIQYFEGIVLARKGAGVSKSFTIRKIGAGGIAVERIFPVNCPSLASYEIRRRGDVRRAKIYFLRDIVGSTANVIKERKVAKDIQQVQEARAAKKAAKVEKRAAKQENPKVKVAKTQTTRSAKRASKKTS